MGDVERDTKVDLSPINVHPQASSVIVSAELSGTAKFIITIFITLTMAIVGATTYLVGQNSNQDIQITKSCGLIENISSRVDMIERDYQNKMTKIEDALTAQANKIDNQNDNINKLTLEVSNLNTTLRFYITKNSELMFSSDRNILGNLRQIFETSEKDAEKIN